ncbi:MAG: hypothetical protein HRT36_01505 [Alphaproteobacteria bacterium]|nr:hypothetical protein [Alphaproteobacteria bacterium]
MQISNGGSVWYVALQIAKATTDKANKYEVETGQPFTVGAVVLTSMRNGEFGYKAFDETCDLCEARAPKGHD